MTLIVKCYDREKVLKVLENYLVAYVTPCDTPNTLNLHLPYISNLDVFRNESVVITTYTGYVVTLKYTDYLNLEIH